MTSKKGGNPAPKTKTPKEDPNLRRRMWAPTVGAHIVGAVLCPHLASEMGSMFQAQGQARVKNGMKHIGEETFVQACLCFLTADTMHHRWFFDTSCHDVDFKCAPSCLPLLPSVYVGGSHQEAFFL